jgi:(4-(4-[2-(gamma-L-glutamylamino)ethyl]phenoxymethyl)furan-2-yl)methanamine synthase
MTDSLPTWLALDVGGANLKAAHSSGQAHTLPFELWKRPDDLPRALATLVEALPVADRLALTMTGELCDCYPTKAIGVRSILDATLRAFPGCSPLVWGIDGRFHSIEEIRENPRLAAAANWLALATLASRLIPSGPGLLIDVGSTTTDLIPIHHGRVAVQGRTDTERLQTGELVYAGVRRTPLCALAVELPFRGCPTSLMAELFATTLDVYLTLGEIPDDPEAVSPADGRPATTDAALDRLARMVGADRDGFDDSDAFELSQSLDDVLMARLRRAAERVTWATVGRPDHIVVAGSGEFLARRLATQVLSRGGTILSLADAWGPGGSTAACAHALAVLASESSEERGSA